MGESEWSSKYFSSDMLPKGFLNVQCILSKAANVIFQKLKRVRVSSDVSSREITITKYHAKRVLIVKDKLINL